jgi:acetoin utilization deacetylase AcuC-like enzyme
VIVVSSPRFAEHTTPPGHPERPDRAEVFDAVAESFRARGGDVRDPRLVTDDELARVHTARYLAEFAGLAGRAAMLDADTYTSPESHEIARLAAGAAVQAGELAWSEGRPVLALVRPPGHHAEPDRAMGFCLLNNIAVAAAALRASGCARVAIVDIDVHHGNGTQAAFFADPTVLYVSTHQFPYYPGTGAADERGAGEGIGATLNIPLPVGTTDEAFVAAYADKVVPALHAFRPDVVLVSAGFDAHRLDPLGGLRVSTEGYARVVLLIDEAARRLCGRRSAWITEGGYHLAALSDCLEATIGVLMSKG